MNSTSGRGPRPPEPAAPTRIKNVWKYNVEQEVGKISALVDEGFCFVAMDTEFPGTIYAYPSDKAPEGGYRMLKQNVDALKLIQVGITMSKPCGEKPKEVHTWQFNLRFNLGEDRHNPESINLLRAAGIGFDELAEHGIDPMVLGDLLMTSGLVVNPEVTWIAFHGTYDFAYLLRALLNELLPHTADDFLRYMKHCFPCVYDIKTIVNDIDDWKARSLSKLAEQLSIQRHGATHQAGSDALLTMDVFFAVVADQFPKGLPAKYVNAVFGFHNEGALLNYSNESSYVASAYSYQSYMYPTPEASFLDGLYPNASIGAAFHFGGRGHV